MWRIFRERSDKRAIVVKAWQRETFSELRRKLFRERFQQLRPIIGSVFSLLLLLHDALTHLPMRLDHRRADSSICLLTSLYYDTFDFSNEVRIITICYSLISLVTKVVRNKRIANRYKFHLPATVGSWGNVATGSDTPYKIFSAQSPPLRVVLHRKDFAGVAGRTFPPRSRPFTVAVHGRNICLTKTCTTMKTRKFEIAVAGYPDYRFKTLARDGVEAAIKIKCFLRKPDAKRMILRPSLNKDLRETQSCRRQVAAR